MIQQVTNTVQEGPASLSAPCTLAVYAPFGTDAELSTYPGGETRDIVLHPLVRNLQAVADAGVDVLALIDRFDDSTYLLSIPARHSTDMTLEPRGKVDMLSYRTLADFVSLAHRRHPAQSLVLTFEGHGAGYLPELDPLELARLKVAGSGLPAGGQNAQAGDAVLPGGNPTTPGGNPTMPGGNPTMPAGHQAISTWALGAGLREADAAKIAVIHFNNCFNMSIEILHTVAPYAEFATGYCNYNFFTAGQAYPAVFERLAASGTTSSEQLAKWFALENHDMLAAAGHEPTVAGTVELSRMRHIVEKVDALSDEFLAALRVAAPADRAGVVAQIKQAIVAAQKYDTSGDFVLGAPDELTDLDSLAYELMQIPFEHGKVHAAADALRNALAGIKQYGDEGAAWMAPGDIWNFSSKYLAMNIFLPDPLREGLWDWRSQYYLDVNPDPGKPATQRGIIDFVKLTDWVDFLREYHRDTPFVGTVDAMLPSTPMLNSTFDPRHPTHPVDARRPSAHARAAATRASLK